MCWVFICAAVHRLCGVRCVAMVLLLLLCEMSLAPCYHLTSYIHPPLLIVFTTHHAYTLVNTPSMYLFTKLDHNSIEQPIHKMSRQLRCFISRRRPMTLIKRRPQHHLSFPRHRQQQHRQHQQQQRWTDMHRNPPTHTRNRSANHKRSFNSSSAAFPKPTTLFKTPMSPSITGSCARLFTTHRPSTLRPTGSLNTLPTTHMGVVVNGVEYTPSAPPPKIPHQPPSPNEPPYMHIFLRIVLGCVKICVISYALLIASWTLAFALHYTTHVCAVRCDGEIRFAEVYVIGLDNKFDIVVVKSSKKIDERIDTLPEPLSNFIHWVLNDPEAC